MFEPIGTTEALPLGNDVGRRMVTADAVDVVGGGYRRIPRGALPTADVPKEGVSCGEAIVQCGSPPTLAFGRRGKT